MPIFKTTYNVLKKYDEDELFDPNWMDAPAVYTPPTSTWDYSRELSIEDVSVWEVLHESSGGIGVYAAWEPYAEFYMVTVGNHLTNIRYIGKIAYYDRIVETFYGLGASQKVKKRAEDLGVFLFEKQIWVDDEHLEMLHNKSINEKVYVF